MVDLTDMHGYADISTVKNLSAYTNSFSTNKEINDAFTKVLRRHGISSMKTYDEALSPADIGQQAMMFAQLPLPLLERRSENFEKRMALLDTEAGVKEFIFHNPHDPIGAALRDGRISWLDPVVQDRINNEKSSLQRRMLAGEWIGLEDTEDNPISFNQMLNKLQITSSLQARYNTRDEQIAAARDIVSELYANQVTDGEIKEYYTDDELAAIFGLGGVEGGAVLDFARPDQDNVVVTRSPTSFNQFVSGKNYAKIALPILKAMDPKFNAQGLYLNDADYEKLSSADIDGDSVKTIYGDFGNAMAATSMQQQAVIEKVNNMPSIGIKHMPLPEEAAKSIQDTRLHRELAIEGNMSSSLGMGSGSAIGERISQLD